VLIVLAAIAVVAAKADIGAAMILDKITMAALNSVNF
jgi:hypothetical protein